MANLSLKTKLSLFFIIPLSTVSVANGIVLYYAGHLKLLTANLLIFTTILVYSKYFIQRFMDKLMKDLELIYESADTVKYSSSLLNTEFSRTLTKPKQFESWRKDLARIRDSLAKPEGDELAVKMKGLLIFTLQEAEKWGNVSKGQIQIARELAKLCTELKTLSSTSQESHDEALALLDSFDLKLHEAEEKTLHFEKPLIISESISTNATRVTKVLMKLGIGIKHKEKDLESPFEIAVIRKAIKRAEKRAA